MQVKCNKYKDLLIQKIKEKVLTEDEKNLIRIAMIFGYTSAFCSRTCDMNESFFMACEYNDAYENILEMIE